MLHVLFNNLFYRFIFYDINSSSWLTNIHPFTFCKLFLNCILELNLLPPPKKLRKKIEKNLTPSVKTIHLYTNDVELSNNCRIKVSIQGSALAA